ncbi:RND transporter [Klebsiella pneumoniae]|uniref:RND transporter n=1 Tax=Klebsiella pneumoniae subsp. pneumoniae TaxID=72407 RepID=A0A377ZJT2_KLEPN|nr:RND transporter [Klebsiella pneumoniae subsp. pneumoniae]STV28532.1 RND transporter [Klebsiella pneumoniae]
MKEIGLPLLLLTALASPAFAADCQPNGIGGSFCINDDGTTTDTVPNEVNGMDTYSNNGGYTSSLPDRSGRMKHWKVHRCRRSKASAADRATVRWRVATGIRPPI